MPDSAAAPAGVSSRARSTRLSAMATPTASRNTGASRKENSVPSKSMPTSPMANPPASERRQERADARGGAQTDALEDVEEELHV